MAVDLKRVEELNKRAVELNATRQKQLGFAESAKATYDKSVLLYKQKWGVDIDDTNLQAEYNAESAVVQKAVDDLEVAIKYIDSGDYKQSTVDANVTNIAKDIKINSEVVTDEAGIDISEKAYTPDGWGTGGGANLNSDFAFASTII